ncbi:cytochrome c4 [Cupriavidus pinatubonensis]|uniref:Cytochrome c, class I n=2 Tax=Burkholderiaceae TaxID=119060 RepID=Q46Q21_CUPPJ|nr:cytochrome c4 [Cupriavidus pinatubonensis]TPQ37792.1 cytochrome c4 [Cupriavidus pinatubonensis]
MAGVSPVPARRLPALMLLLSLCGVAGQAIADAAAGQAKAQVCVACHGPQGNSTNPAYPELAGQTARYLYLQLRDFKEGRRSDPAMSPMAAPLSREDMQDLADYFAAQKPIPSTYKVEAARVEAGRKKSEEILCTMCHLGGFSGQNEIPRVAGQQYAYIVKQLEDFRAKRRTNDAGNMTSVSRNLSDEDIRNLASYITNLN